MFRLVNLVERTAATCAVDVAAVVAALQNRRLCLLSATLSIVSSWRETRPEHSWPLGGYDLKKSIPLPSPPSPREELHNTPRLEPPAVLSESSTFSYDDDDDDDDNVEMRIQHQPRPWFHEKTVHYHHSDFRLRLHQDEKGILTL